MQVLQMYDIRMSFEGFRELLTMMAQFKVQRQSTHPPTVQLPKASLRCNLPHGNAMITFAENLRV